MILWFTYLLVFVGKAVGVVRKIASQVHCKGDVATQQTYRRCYASFHTVGNRIMQIRFSLGHVICKLIRPRGKKHGGDVVTNL